MLIDLGKPDQEPAEKLAALTRTLEQLDAAQRRADAAHGEVQAAVRKKLGAGVVNARLVEFKAAQEGLRAVVESLESFGEGR